MDERDFKELYQQEWQPTDEYKEALRLWCGYFYHAELHDRSLVHFSDESGCPVMAGFERHKSALYARRLRGELKSQSELIPRDVLQQAKIEASRYSFEMLEKIVMGG